MQEATAMLLKATAPSEVGRRSLRSERGQDLVEFALVFPILILLILGIIEFAILILDYNTVSNAAREGARYAIVHPESDRPEPGAQCPNPPLAADAPPSNVVEAACKMTTGLDPDNIRVVVDFTAGAPASLGRVTVTVRYDAELLTAPVIEALGGGGAITVGGASTMEMEQS
jgi:Flp pilus assembly protein TadG